MATITVKLADIAGLTLFAFPIGASLADWATSRVAILEETPPNGGRYTTALDDTIATQWHIFVGATAPSDWGQNIGEIDISSTVVDNAAIATAVAAAVLVTPANKLATNATGQVAVSSLANDALTAAALATDAVTEITTAVGALTPAAAFFTNAPAGLTAAQVRAAIGLAAADLDTQLSGISGKTTNLPTDPADASDIAAAFSALTTIVNLVKAKTDNLTATPASVSDIPTAIQNGASAAAAILANPANLLTTNATGQVQVSALAADTVTASALATSAVAEIVAAIEAGTPLAGFFTNSSGGSGLSPAITAALQALTDAGITDLEWEAIAMLAIGRRVVDSGTSRESLYRRDGITLLKQFNLTSAAGGGYSARTPI
jgi:hypothetical protein